MKYFVYAYHYLGDKATEIFKSIDQPYEKDFVHWSVVESHPESYDCLALFIFTDHAETYASEIDACINQGKDVVINFLFLTCMSAVSIRNLRKSGNSIISSPLIIVACRKVYSIIYCFSSIH